MANSRISDSKYGIQSKRSRVDVDGSMIDYAVPNPNQHEQLIPNFQVIEVNGCRNRKNYVKINYEEDPKETEADAIAIAKFAWNARSCADRALNAVQHALLRQQADAVAYYIQQTVKYSGANSIKAPNFKRGICPPNKQLEEHSSAASNDVESNVLLRRAKREAMVSLREAEKHLKRTSAEVGSWHVDTRDVRHFANALVEVKRGGVELDPCLSSTEPPFISSDSDNLYLIDERNGAKVYSASKSAVEGTQGMQLTPIFNGKYGCFVMGLCSLKDVGRLVLLLLPDDGLTEPDNYLLELHLLDSTLRHRFGNCNVNTSCLLFPMRGRRVLVADLGSAELTILKVDSVSNTISIDRQLLLERKQLRSFAYNETCGFALATYEKVAKVLPLDSQVDVRTTIEIDNWQHVFRKCAVSSHPIFFILKLINHEHAEGQLFDVHGQQLRRVANNYDYCQLFNTLISPNRNFAMFETNSANELHLLHFSCFDRSLQHVKVCSKRGFAHQICSIDLDNVDRKLVQHRSKFRVMRESNLSLIDYSRLRVHDDRLQPSVRYFVQDKAAFYVLDSENNAVKRFSKVPNSSHKLQNTYIQYKPEQQSTPDDFVTAFEILDENTLVVLHSNSTLVHVDASTMRRMHSVRFTNTRLAKYRTAATISKMAETKLIVAVEGDKAVYEVERTQHSTDWRLVKLHKLPRPWKLQHIYFDSSSRQFSLVLTEQKEQHTPLCILNDQLVMLTKISLPVYYHVYASLLKGNWCFLKLLNDANYTAWSLLDINSRKIFEIVRATCHAWIPIRFTSEINNSEFSIEECCNLCREVVRTTYRKYRKGDV